MKVQNHKNNMIIRYLKRNTNMNINNIFIIYNNKVNSNVSSINLNILFI